MTDMKFREFEEMKGWVRFTSKDMEHLRQLGPLVASHFSSILNSFYDRLQTNKQAREVILDKPGRLDRLKRTLADWLEDLFGGVYDEAYLEKRCEIGRTHVSVELPQRFMFTAMNIIRTEFGERIRSLGLADCDAKLDALNKLLDIELAIMLETYRDDYVERIRLADRVTMRRELDEVQHMAEIGQLAASLAHEIKNPLAGISGAIQIIARETDESDPHLEIMREILRQTDRLDSAVKDLLIFARPMAPEFGRHDIGQLIRKYMTALQGDPAVKSLQVECIGLDQSVRGTIDVFQFEQVISNLVLNAAQACDKDGRVQIKLDKVNGRCLIQVKDNGKGMPPEVLRQAMQPFFTTKAKGTGLGLSICKRIIEAHDGHIEIKTAPGKGTVVEISLPETTRSKVDTGGEHG